MKIKRRNRLWGRFQFSGIKNIRLATYFSASGIKQFTQGLSAKAFGQVFAFHAFAGGEIKGAAAVGADFINEQNGMFSFSGLDKDQVEALRKDFGIYIVGSGRICVAGINTNNIDKVVAAITAVVKK